jgi:hypothetical protein
MAHQNEWFLYLELFQRHFQVLLEPSHTISPFRPVRFSMAAQIEGDRPVREGKFMQLVLPLKGLASISVKKNDRVSRTLRVDIDGRKVNGGI